MEAPLHLQLTGHQPDRSASPTKLSKWDPRHIPWSFSQLCGCVPATAAYQLPISEIDSDHWPEQIISVIGPRGRMCGRLQEEIRFCCTAPNLLSYWTERYNWADDTHQPLDQSGADRAISRLDSANLTRVQKVRCGWLPVNQHLTCEDPDRTAGCTACKPVHSVDKTDHVLQCFSPLHRGLLVERLSSFTATLRKWKTAPIICQILLAAAHHWGTILSSTCRTTLRLYN